MQEMGLIPGREDPLEKEMATHSSILAWEIPWTEEPGGLQSMGLQTAGHDLATKQQYILVFYSFLLPNKMKVKVKSLSHVCLFVTP